MKRATLISLMAVSFFTSCAEAPEDQLPTLLDVSATDSSGVADTSAAPDGAKGSDTSGGDDVIQRARSSCDMDADCDDGLSCTADACVAEEGVSRCQWSLLADQCLINGVCYTAADSRDTEVCLRCQPEQSQTAWTRAVGAAICDDSDACTSDDACTETGCAGAPIPCDDGLACTTDSCSDGVCLHTAVQCSDDNPCTEDSCNDAGNCLFEPIVAPCDLDGDACTSDQCAAGACTAGPPLDCDDGDFCTIDLCDTDVGCVTLPTQTPCCAGAVSLCDDGDPCTDDLCDELTGDCSTAFNSAVCDDGDPCTTGDACLEGACSGVLDSCDDGNPCTADSCEGGCVNAPIEGGACDDGLECTVNDTCQAGQCVSDTSGCVCEPEFSPVANKVVGLQLGSSAEVGQGLDLDGDPSTCAPTPCSSGVDNALGLVSALVNESLADSVSDGSLVLVIEHRGFPVGGGPYAASLYRAALAPENESCDYQAEVCDFLVNPGLFDQTTCQPLFELPTVLEGDQLSAGGPGTVFPFAIPLSPTATLELMLYNVQLNATLTIENGVVSNMTGLLGGAVQKDDLKDAIAGLPEGALPLPPEQVAPLIDSLIQNDIDTNDDGVADAASIGISLQAIATNLVGLGDPPPPFQ